MMWNEAEVEELRRLTALGHSAGQISQALGKTRNSIIGKWRRLGDVAGIRTPRQRHEEQSKKRSRKRKRLLVVKFVILKAASQPQNCGTIKFVDHKITQCHYIPGDPNGFNTLYCANESIPWLSYCPAHYELCTQNSRRG